MTVEVRPVAEPDAARAALAAVLGEAASDEHLARVLARPDVHLIVAYVADHPAGLAYGYELPRLKRDEARLLLYEIEVLPRYRRGGLGARLIATFLDVARDRECASVWLVTNASNGPAMALYRGAGAERPHRDDVMLRFRV